MITHVRSVGLAVPDLGKAREFYEKHWQLELVEADQDRVYLGAGCPDSHVVRLRAAAESRIDVISLAVDSVGEVDRLAARVMKVKGSRVAREPGQRADFGAGYGFSFFDCDGRLVELAADVGQRAFRPVEEAESRPKSISHVVFNTPDVHATVAFYQAALGMRISDWIQDFFCFLRSGPAHHILAFTQAGHASLNHVSFEVRGLDEFMRATGSMMRRGHQPLWGPGRHRAGGNTFSYFRDPGTGFIMEYTTALQKIDDEHGWTPKVYSTSSEDTDQWGTANPFDEVVLTAMHGGADPGLWTIPPA